MSFELANALIVFMDLINGLFRDCLDKFIVVFINKKLVYSLSHEEYEQHLERTL